MNQKRGEKGGIFFVVCFCCCVVFTYYSYIVYLTLIRGIYILFYYSYNTYECVLRFSTILLLVYLLYTTLHYYYIILLLSHMLYYILYYIGLLCCYCCCACDMVPFVQEKCNSRFRVQRRSKISHLYCNGKNKKKTKRTSWKRGKCL